MLQSSDSALCVQTQQGERGRLSLGPVPKWAGPAWCQGFQQLPRPQGGEEPGGSDYTPGSWPALTPGGRVGAALGSRAVCKPTVVFQCRAQTGGCVTLGKSLRIRAHGLGLPLSAKFTCSLFPPAVLQPSLHLLHSPCA